MANTASLLRQAAPRRLCQRPGSVIGASYKPRLLLHRAQLRKRVIVTASLTSKGRRLNSADLSVKRIMGEGSFGQVFEGSLETSDGPAKVVVKRVKARVLGAEEMAQAEHLLNVYASKVAKGSCADFLGYCEVSQEEATPRLTAGVWLIWKYEGSRTLAYYLKRRDTLRVLSQDLCVPEDAVVPTVMKHICTAIQAFHASGLVHRDIKPLNIIFSEKDKKFKLIDLGACADLRNGTNYKPDESILDPNFCPPEQYVLPTDAPHLSQTPFSMAISPMLWALHKPDRFDSWSAGLILMQLCVPSLRSDRGLKSFNTALQRADYDLQRWRLGANLRKSEVLLLDAYGGAGWDLAQSLLRPRRIVYDTETGDVAFVNDGSVQRVSMAETLRHPLLKFAREPELEVDQAVYLAGGKATKESGSGTKNVLASAMGAWRNLTNKLFDLEAQMIVTATATEQATQTLKKLKASRASSREVKTAETKLGLMQDQMGSLEQELVKTSAQAQGLLGFLGFNKPKAPLPDPAGLPPVSGTSGSRGSKSGSRGSKGSSKQSAPVTPKSPDLWQQMAGQLLKLEDVLLNMTTATEQQTLTVKRLRRDVELGNAEPGLLLKAERVLSRMQRRVDQLQTDYTQLSSEAADILREANSGSTKDRVKKGSGSTKASPANPTMPAASSSAPKPGSWWSRSPKAQAAEAVEPTPEPAGIEEPAADNTLIKAGLRFTGVMVRLAGDMAGMIEKDAEEKKLARAVDASFMELLKENQLSSLTTFMEAEFRLGSQPRWQALEPKRRPQLYTAYCAAARRLEEQQQVQNEARLKALYLRVGIAVNTTWSELRPLVMSDAAFNAIPDEAQRLKVFDQLLLEARQQELLLKQRETAEDDFRRLLAEVRNPAISADSRWPLVKQQLWNDPRYNPLTERRRQTIYQEYIDALRATGPAALIQPSPPSEPVTTPAPLSEPEPTPPAVAEVAAAEPPVVEAAPPTTASAAAAAVDTTSPAFNDLAELLQQQSMLREEYRRMEAKLREMEAKMNSNDKNGASEGEPLQPPPIIPTAATPPFPLPTASVEEEEDGSMIFQFEANGTKPLQVASRSKDSSS